MRTIWIWIGVIPLALSSCISVSVEAGPTAPPRFVTATLGPTRPGFVPPTLTRTPRGTEAAVLPTTFPGGCRDEARLLQDVTVPDDSPVEAGAAFTKTWEFQNSGSCRWDGYTVVFASGEAMGAPASAPVPETAAGGTVRVSMELTAPAADGRYAAFFTLNDASGRPVAIGTEETFWVRIVVGDLPTATPQAPVSGSATRFVPAGGNDGCAYTRNDGYVQDLLGRINAARAAAGLPALAVNPQLTAAAQAHSADMACNNFLGHTGTDGLWIGDRLRRAGYPADKYYVEIIAIGTPQNAMDQWRADPPHWEAVLDPGVTEFGAGYAYFAESDFGGYITVDFGAQ